MLTIFNRKELYVTFSMEDRNRILDILDANSVRCDMKAVSRSGGFGGSRARTGQLLNIK